MLKLRILIDSKNTGIISVAYLLDLFLFHNQVFHIILVHNLFSSKFQFKTIKSHFSKP